MLDRALRAWTLFVFSSLLAPASLALTIDFSNEMRNGMLVSPASGLPMKPSTISVTRAMPAITSFTIILSGGLGGYGCVRC